MCRALDECFFVAESLDTTLLARVSAWALKKFLIQICWFLCEIDRPKFKKLNSEQQLLSERMWRNNLPAKCDSNLACSDKLIFILQGEKFKEVMKRGQTSSPLQTCVIANISVILSHLCSIHSPSKSIWQIFQNAHPRLFNNNHFILCNKVLKEYLAVS